MPGQEYAFLYQDALLWLRTGTDAYAVDTVAATPLELKVRWDGAATRMQDPQKGSITVDATVIVDQDILMGSRMWLGTLDEYTADTDADREIMEVKVTNYVSDVKNREVFRKVGLMRLRNVQ